MKKLYTMAFLAAVLFSCRSEKIDFGGGSKGSDEETGYMAFGAEGIAVAEYAEEITSGCVLDDGSSVSPQAPGAVAPASDDYKVKIVRVKTGDVAEYTFGDLKKPENAQIPLAPGAYLVRAESPDYSSYIETSAGADWEKPVYAAEASKTVVGKEVTEVKDLVCTLANIKATVSMTPDLQGLFMSDAECESQGKDKLSVTLSNGSASLVYDRTASESGKAGYFKASDAGTTVKVTLVGQYNKAAGDEEPVYVPVKWDTQIPNCKAGQWRKISIGVENADNGNVQFVITVENWVYDEKIDVDVMSMYQAGEETIPDEEISDKNSIVVTVDGHDIAEPYRIDPTMYDADLGKWNTNLKVVMEAQDNASISSVDVRIDSDNGSFLEAVDAAGIAGRTVALVPADENVSGYVISKTVSSSGMTFTVNDAGMTALLSYKGKHTFRFVAEDSERRISYTDLMVEVHDSGVVVTGPSVVWTNKDNTVTYDFGKRYNHDQVEVCITIETESAFTGFTVDIDSNILTPDELESVGLSSHLDMVNPGDMEDTLRNFGFPVGSEFTSGKSHFIDITSFMGLISVMQMDGYCDFRLTVTDESGTTERTIQLDVKIN